MRKPSPIESAGRGDGFVGPIRNTATTTTPNLLLDKGVHISAALNTGNRLRVCALVHKEHRKTDPCSRNSDAWQSNTERAQR